ncbi:MAG: hypothetical protein U1E51_36315 [Candidatus Binatia bacterium]|nr:hypothetical protein [Candidatus Binatia bacterium]
MNLNESKPSYLSETIIGILVAVLGPLAAKYNLVFDAGIANDLLAAGTALIGAIIGIHGRITARKRVTLL